jgi:hypothetical protein
MAEHGHNHTDEQHGHGSARGKMDISEHVATWHAFWNVSVWSVAGLMGLALLLAIFRTHNG